MCSENREPKTSQTLGQNSTRTEKVPNSSKRSSHRGNQRPQRQQAEVQYYQHQSPAPQAAAGKRSHRLSTTKEVSKGKAAVQTSALRKNQSGQGRPVASSKGGSTPKKAGRTGHTRAKQTSPNQQTNSQHLENKRMNIKIKLIRTEWSEKSMLFGIHQHHTMNKTLTSFFFQREKKFKK